MYFKVNKDLFMYKSVNFLVGFNGILIYGIDPSRLFWEFVMCESKLICTFSTYYTSTRFSFCFFFAFQYWTFRLFLPWTRRGAHYSTVGFRVRERVLYEKVEAQKIYVTYIYIYICSIYINVIYTLSVPVFMAKVH